MKLRGRRRTELREALAHVERQIDAPTLDLTDLRPKIMPILADWRGLAAKHVAATRQLLRKLLVGRVKGVSEIAADLPAWLRGWI